MHFLVLLEIERSLDLSTNIVTNVLTRSTTVNGQPTDSNQNPWTLSKVKQPTRLSLLSKLVEARSQYLDSDRLKHRNPPSNVATRANRLSIPVPQDAIYFIIRDAS